MKSNILARALQFGINKVAASLGQYKELDDFINHEIKQVEGLTVDQGILEWVYRELFKQFNNAFGANSEYVTFVNAKFKEAKESGLSNKDADLSSYKALFEQWKPNVFFPNSENLHVIIGQIFYWAKNDSRVKLNKSSPVTWDNAIISAKELIRKEVQKGKDLPGIQIEKSINPLVDYLVQSPKIGKNGLYVEIISAGPDLSEEDFKRVKERCKQEGMEGDHCVYTNHWHEVKSGQATIYSLRDKDRGFVATMRVDDTVLVELKGYSNQPIENQYKKDVWEWFTELYSKGLLTDISKASDDLRTLIPEDSLDSYIQENKLDFLCPIIEAGNLKDAVGPDPYAKINEIYKLNKNNPRVIKAILKGGYWLITSREALEVLDNYYDNQDVMIAFAKNIKIVVWGKDIAIDKLVNHPNANVRHTLFSSQNGTLFKGYLTADDAEAMSKSNNGSYLYSLTINNDLPKSLLKSLCERKDLPKSFFSILDDNKAYEQINSFYLDILFCNYPHYLMHTDCVGFVNKHLTYELFSTLLKNIEKHSVKLSALIFEFVSSESQFELLYSFDKDLVARMLVSNSRMEIPDNKELIFSFVSKDYLLDIFNRTILGNTFDISAASFNFGAKTAISCLMDLIKVNPQIKDLAASLLVRTVNLNSAENANTLDDETVRSLIEFHKEHGLKPFSEALTVNLLGSLDVNSDESIKLGQEFAKEALNYTLDMHVIDFYPKKEWSSIPNVGKSFLSAKNQKEFYESFPERIKELAFNMHLSMEVYSLLVKDPNFYDVLNEYRTVITTKSLAKVLFTSEGLSLLNLDLCSNEVIIELCLSFNGKKNREFLILYFIKNRGYEILNHRDFNLYRGRDNFLTLIENVELQSLISKIALRDSKDDLTTILLKNPFLNADLQYQFYKLYPIRFFETCPAIHPSVQEKIIKEKQKAGEPIDIEFFFQVAGGSLKASKSLTSLIFKDFDSLAEGKDFGHEELVVFVASNFLTEENIQKIINFIYPKVHNYDEVKAMTGNLRAIVELFLQNLSIDFQYKKLFVFEFLEYLSQGTFNLTGVQKSIKALMQQSPVEFEPILRNFIISSEASTLTIEQYIGTLSSEGKLSETFHMSLAKVRPEFFEGAKGKLLTPNILKALYESNNIRVVNTIVRETLSPQQKDYLRQKYAFTNSLKTLMKHARFKLSYR